MTTLFWLPPVLVAAITQVALGASMGDGTKYAAVRAGTPLTLRTHVKQSYTKSKSALLRG